MVLRLADCRAVLATGKHALGFYISDTGPSSALCLNVNEIFGLKLQGSLRSIVGDPTIDRVINMLPIHPLYALFA